MLIRRNVYGVMLNVQKSSNLILNNIVHCDILFTSPLWKHWRLWAAVFTFNPYLLISINELLISIIHLLISINELLISINELLISINTASSTVFIDIYNEFIDINKGIIDINNSFIDINKYG